MSGWKVLCLEPVKSRRDATDDKESYDGYHNPNRAVYRHRYGDPYDDPEGMRASDRIKKILVEDHNAMVDSKHGTVFASMGGYDANWGLALRDTFLMWDKAAVIEANDTSDTGKVHVYDRTWDGSRGKRRRDLPTSLCVEEDVFHEEYQDAVAAVEAHEDRDENADRRLNVVEVDGVWMVHSSEQWDSDEHGGLHVNEYVDGRHPFDNMWHGHPDDVPLSDYKVDEYTEVECRDGRPVGEKAAAYAQLNWNIHTRAGIPLGWDWDHTRAEQTEWRYRVCLGVPEVSESVRDLFDHKVRVSNRVLESDYLYTERTVAIAQAAIIERETGMDTWVEPVPVSLNWAGGVDREYDPCKFPDYDGGALDNDPRPEQYQ